MRLSEVQTSGTDFFTFFGIHQVATVPMLEVSVIKKFKPGGFQENIDIEITEDLKENLLSASLLIDRSWLGNREHLNPFALDITKSFLSTFTAPEDQPKMHEIAEEMFKLHGTKDKVISLQSEKKNPRPNLKPVAFQHIHACLVNKMQEVEIKLKACNVCFKNLEINGKLRFELGIMYPEHLFRSESK